jgi:hypothetical protein
MQATYLWDVAAKESRAGALAWRRSSEIASIPAEPWLHVEKF